MGSISSRGRPWIRTRERGSRFRGLRDPSRHSAGLRPIVFSANFSSFALRSFIASPEEPLRPRGLPPPRPIDYALAWPMIITSFGRSILSRARELSSGGSSRRSALRAAQRIFRTLMFSLPRERHAMLAFDPRSRRQVRFNPVRVSRSRELPLFARLPLSSRCSHRLRRLSTSPLCNEPISWSQKRVLSGRKLHRDWFLRGIANSAAVGRTKLAVRLMKPSPLAIIN